MESILSSIVCSALFLISALPSSAEDVVITNGRELTVLPAQVTEGNSFRQGLEIVVPPTLDFVFELRQPKATPVTGTYGVRPGRTGAEFGSEYNSVVFNWSVSDYAPATDGTYFTPGADFTQVTGVPFTIPAGSTSITVKVPVFPDYQDEPDEYVQLFIESVSGISNTLTLSVSALGTIKDDDEPPPAVLPTLTMTSQLVFEGTPPPASGYLSAEQVQLHRPRQPAESCGDHRRRQYRPALRTRRGIRRRFHTADECVLRHPAELHNRDHQRDHSAGFAHRIPGVSRSDSLQHHRCANHKPVRSGRDQE